MARQTSSCLLTELSWVDVREQLARDSRLIVPVGACDQYGPHLPIGACTLIAEAVADELSRDFGVLRAPTLPYGVNVPAETPYAGTAGVQEKTLHRLLNDLLASWEDHGVTEFILITAHRYDAHVEAVATVAGTRARVRVLEILEIDFDEYLDGPGSPEHGGEIMTSLMLYLYPDKVNSRRMTDFRPDDSRGTRRLRMNCLPVESPGSYGEPTLGTAEKGRRIFEHILRKIRLKLFLAPVPEAGEEETK